LFQLLYSGVDEVRKLVARRLVQLTNDGHEYGDRLWGGEDNRAAREEAARAWAARWR
jgi:hypothetical protein